MWWFNKKHLPLATGPYVPGCIDFMVDFSIKGLFATFYYPTNAKRDDETNSKRWIPWLPNDHYLYGIAKTMLVYPIFIRMITWYYSVTSTYIPVLYGKEIRTDEKLQCVIFSHGLGGFKFLYSHIFAQLASRGYLVIALEHRDQSACYTYYYQSEHNAKNDIRTPIFHKNIGLHKTHYFDRNRQVHYRAEECSRMLDVILKINEGVLPQNIIDLVPTKHEMEFKLGDLVGRIDVDNITMAGHSFGGATALLTLSKRKEFKQGIVLDPWMFPIKDENLPEKVTQPMIFINTETFHIIPNVDALAKYMEKDGVEMYTILHTTHEHQGDTALLVGSWLNLFKKKLDPIDALGINNNLIYRFLNKHTGHPKDLKKYESYLEVEKANFESGLTKPWA